MFVQLKNKATGLRVRITFSQVSAFEEQADSTLLHFNNGATLEVAEGYQTVSNRAAKADTAAVEEQAAPEAE